MVKKIVDPKRMGGVENRLLGVEKRLSRLEDEAHKTRWQLVKFGNELHGVENSFIKMEDHFMKEFEEFRSKMFTLIDPLFGQLKRFNEEQGIHAGQHQEVYEKVEKLQKIHPQGQHAIA